MALVVMPLLGGGASQLHLWGGGASQAHPVRRQQGLQPERSLSRVTLLSDYECHFEHLKGK